MAKREYRYNPKTLSYEEVGSPKDFSKIIARAIITCALGYFIVGFCFVKWGNFNWDDYLSIGAIVGSASSVAGLYSLFSTRIKKNDIEKIGVEYFRDVVVAADNLKEKEAALKEREQQLGAKEKEIKQLEVKKAELELLVQKASMTIFLHDQLERTEKKIISLVSENKELSNALTNREKTISQLIELEEEIKQGDNSQSVQEIIDLIKNNKSNEASKKEEVTGFKSAAEAIGETLTRLLFR